MENQDIIGELKKYISTPRKTQSDQLNELFTALAKAQAEIKPVLKNKNNPFYKSDYSDLKSVVEASRPALAANGLCVIQLTESEENAQYFITRLCHSSGQWIESRLKLAPVKQDIQSMGSLISYLRRYQYNSLVGVVDTDDDDGNAAMPSNGSKFITSDQVKMLVTALHKKPQLNDYLLKKAGINSWAELTSDRFKEAYRFVLSEINKGV